MDDGRAFDAYVPRVVREWLDAPDPGARHRRVAGSMIFVDISGFTRLSERLARFGKIGSERVTDVIATCFDRLLADAYRYDGSLLKFGGDALLLFFRGEEHVPRAAAAALDMRRSLREMSRFATDAGHVRLGMTVGVHTGSFDFFLIGESHRELVIVGPDSSTLVSTEESASTGEIVVSAECARLLAGRNLGGPRGSGRLLRGRIDTIEGQVTFYDTAHDMTGFVPRAIANAIRSGASLESEHRYVTVAFLTFKGLDDRIADGDAETVADDLHELVSIVQAAVDERGLCFLSTDIAGDGGKIILTAGAPSTTGNDEEQMLLALRAIVDARPAIPVRIGVNAGPVFAGEIGTTHRRNYTVMGDPVNLAARVMAKAAPGQVLATPAVVDRSHTVFDTAPLEPFHVKGKRRPVEAVAAGPARGIQRQLDASDLPLVGRDAEMAQLVEALEAARRGRGRAVEIVAEPGAGKSRLLQAMLSASDGFDVYRVGCRLYQIDTPYQPMSHLLPAVLGLTATTTADRTAELHRIVAARCPQLLPWLSLIGDVLQLDIAESEAVRQLDAAFRTSRLESTVVQLLDAVLTQPSILCVEEAHWIDDASAGVIQAIAHGSGERPWIVLVTRRSRGVPEFDGAPLTRLELAPLDQSSAVELIGAATADRPLPRHVVEAMARRSDGNPLFLLELLSAVRAGGDLESLPTTVEALINARIDRLQVRDRTTLRRASVLGIGFQATHLQAVLPDVEPHHALRPLIDFVSIDDTGLASFRHALVRDVAYEGLPFRIRRQLHGHVADAIRAAEREPDEQIALVSLHLLRAHRDEEAWTCSLRAADKAQQIFANLDAAALYNRALTAGGRLGTIDPSERANVYELLGDVQDLAGVYAEAGDSYATAVRLLHDDPRRRVAVILKEAFVAERQGRYSDAVRKVRRGLKKLGDGNEPDDVRLRARLTTWEAAVRATQGRFREALVGAERGIELSRTVADELNLARAYLIVDFARVNLGGASGEANASAALEIYTRLGDLGGQANAANSLGTHYFYEGRWDDAAALYDRARRAREQMGDPVNAAFFGINLAEILVEQGYLQAAVSALEPALAVLRAADDQWGVAFASQVLGVAKLRIGELAAGAVLLGSARDLYARIGARSSALDTAIGLAEYHLLDGRPEQAIGLLDGLIGEHRAKAGHELQMSAAHRLRGWALAQLGQPVAAEQELRLAISTARQLGSPQDIGFGLDTLARLAPTGTAMSPDEIDERDATLDRLGVIGRPSTSTSTSTSKRL